MTIASMNMNKGIKTRWMIGNGQTGPDIDSCPTNRI
jgi:hypothetical protein